MKNSYQRDLKQKTPTRKSMYKELLRAVAVTTVATVGVLGTIIGVVVLGTFYDRTIEGRAIEYYQRCIDTIVEQSRPLNQAQILCQNQCWYYGLPAHLETNNSFDEAYSILEQKCKK